MNSRKNGKKSYGRNLIRLDYEEQKRRGLLGKLCGYLLEPYLNGNPKRPIVGDCVISDSGRCTHGKLSDNNYSDCPVRTGHQRLANRLYVWTLEQKAKGEELSPVERWVVDNYYKERAEKKRQREQESN